MNREIKFRGKRIDDNTWVYGSLLIDYAGTCQIWQKDESGAQHNFIVDPNTLGQYTGLKDKNDKEIYEGDIVKDVIYNNILTVIFFKGKFEIVYKNTELEIDRLSLGNNHKKLEIIGNIYDNPKLLEEK